MMRLIGGMREAEWTAEYLANHVLHWERHGFGFYLLHDRATGEATGLGGLRTMYLDGVTELEVGYAFLPERWGLGLATEVTTAFLGMARELAEFTSVVAVIHPDNAGSIRVVERLGFELDRSYEHEQGVRLIYRRERF